MIRRLLRALASRGEMPDLNEHFATVADWYGDHTQTAGEQLADEVERWLCTNYCNHKES